jgi:hydrogenase maturation protease
MKILIIGYGNTLRNDDGVGVKTAEFIETRNYPNTRVITTHQLTPELAADIAEVDRVIFMDAILTDDLNIQIKRLELNADRASLGHAESPESLLNFTRSIYGKTPIAYGVYIPATNCEFGEEFSEVTREAMKKAIAAIEALITYEFSAPLI